MQVFKSCLTIVCGLIFGCIAYSMFQLQYDSAIQFANLSATDVATIILAKERARFERETKDFRENSSHNSEPTPPKPMRWSSVDDPEIIKAAESAIARSVEVTRMSAFSIQYRNAELAILGFLYGSISYIFWCFVVRVTVRPLAAALDSIAGNFVRFVVTPFFFTAVWGGILWVGFGPIFKEMVLPSPLGNLGL